MRTYLTSFIVSFLFVLVTTPFLIKIGIKHGFVDKVDQRKIHQLYSRIGINCHGNAFPFSALFYNNFVSQTLFGSIENVVVIIFGGLNKHSRSFDDKGLPAKFKFLSDSTCSYCNCGFQ